PPGGADTPEVQAPPPLGVRTPPPPGAQTPPGAASNSRNDNGLQEGKDRERQERHSSPSTTVGATAHELERLREYLGPSAAAADRFAASAEHSPTWPVAVLGLYGPNGTDEQVWQRSPPDQ